jgi:ankyrin repeat protein
MPGGGGETALMIACRSGRRDNVEALLKLGANTSLRDGWEKSAWDRAKEAGRSDIMELLENFEKKPEGPVISEY